MKVTEHIQAAKNTLISFEILPPLKGKSIQSIFDTLDELKEFNPPYINVTYHGSEYGLKKNPDGEVVRTVVRKRPGTVGICAAIMNRYRVEAVPHIICGGFTVEETEDALIDLHFLGIKNILALRGDKDKLENNFIPTPGGHSHAIDLLKQVKCMNRGRYLEEDLHNSLPTDFCVGVAGYPEKHAESPNMEADLQTLKSKVDAGADYIVTQLFFDNQKFFAFEKACRAMGITVPIIPGIKPLTLAKHLHILPGIFNVEIPQDLVKAVKACKTEEAVKQVGVEWAIQQCRELKTFGVPVLHFYTMSNAAGVKAIVSGL